MRSIEQINKDIAQNLEAARRLQAEKREVRQFEVKKVSAVYVLENLGWTYKEGRWVKPAAQPVHAEFDKDSMTHIRGGDFVTLKTGGSKAALISPDYYRVFRVDGRMIVGQRITSAHSLGYIVRGTFDTLDAALFRVASHVEVREAFNRK